MGWILLIILVLWLFGASLLKVAFEVIVIVGVILLIAAAIGAIRDYRNRV